MSQLRVFSNGFGVQSTAALVLAAQGKIDYQTFVCANVGDDSEHPAALAYYREIQTPYAKAHGIELVEVRRVKRDGTTPTLLEHLMTQRRSIPIPVRMPSGAPGTRSCTADYKIKVIEKYLRSRGATKVRPAVVGLGISLDEFQRMRTNTPGESVQWKEYPLIDLRLNRGDCVRIIQEAGLPIPPKSSCWFCPFHTLKVWQRMHDDEPELFGQAVELERTLNRRRAEDQRDACWLSGALIPLDQAITGNQTVMAMDDNCESGYCHT